jgi:outer membrane immunogenic protein
LACLPGQDGKIYISGRPNAEWSTLGGESMRAKIAFVLAIACLFSEAAFAQGFTLNANGSLSAHSSSWLAGGQFGYNWRHNSILYGLEADLSGMDLKSNTTGALVGAPGTDELAAKIDWYGTVRGRLGWAAGPWLFYGTGGLAYGKVNLNSDFNVAFTDAVPGSLSSQTSPLRAGWVAGAGFEYLLRPNVSLGVGYQYIDLGDVTLSSSTSFPSGAGSVSMAQSARVHAAFQVVAASLNWQFTPGSTGGPWEGFYAGGHAGGAWGNSASADYSATCNACLIAVSDARLKRDIVLVGRFKDGLGLYRYRYLWSDTVYIGVMAQEVALDHPDAVVRDPFGYLRVNYSKLGLQLMTESQWDAVRARQGLMLCYSL